MMNAHIISVGNELLIGDTLNTNASWIGRFLNERGFRVDEVRTISDDYEPITRAVIHALEHARLVICTGGLGPTHDDITKKAVADLFESELVLDEKVLESVKTKFARRGLAFTPSNKEQAMVPVACEVLFNDKGTAPGMWFTKNDSCLAVLPGVPHEMRYLMEERVDRKIRELFIGLEFRATRYLKTAGVSESTLSDEVIGDLSEYIDNGSRIAYLPSPSGVTLRVSTSGTSHPDAEKRLDPLLRFIREKAAGLIYTEGRDVQLSGVLGEILSRKGKSLAVAESCTGGALANSITDIPGSSGWFRGGEVAYADQVKIDRLGVSEEILKTNGAVSIQVALQMAKGVALLFGTHIGVSTTGIAGPGGGSKYKPVGTVWMGFWIEGQHFALKACFTNDRLINKERTVAVVLETLRRQLIGLDTFPYDLKPRYI